MKDVALFTRAWIEIRLNLEEITFKKVALFTRAWIEIRRLHNESARIGVALFTRAWIEIDFLISQYLCNVGRPLHEGVD